MNRREAMTWVLSVCGALRLSQAKTLSKLVGALEVSRVSLSAIGRGLCGQAMTKGSIQPTWGFISNPRVVVSDAMRGVMAHLFRGRQKKRLLTALDWTEIRNFHTPMAAVMSGSLRSAVDEFGPDVHPAGRLGSLRSAPSTARACGAAATTPSSAACSPLVARCCIACKPRSEPYLPLSALPSLTPLQTGDPSPIGVLRRGGGASRISVGKLIVPPGNEMFPPSAQNRVGNAVATESVGVP